MGRNILVRGNVKMGPDVYIFNLPPEKTCVPSEWCRKNCYALKGNFRLPNAKESAEWHYQASLRADFVDLIVAEIKRLEKRKQAGKIGEFYVRVHASGDFYGEEYVGKWLAIAQACPEVLFRTTTKRDDLAKAIRRLDALPNFIVRESLDPSRPKATMGLSAISAVSTTSGIKFDGMLKCPNDCPKCGYRCWTSRTSNYFAPH